MPPSRRIAGPWLKPASSIREAAGPEQTETFSRRVKLGRDGRVSISTSRAPSPSTAAIWRRGLDRCREARRAATAASSIASTSWSKSGPAAWTFATRLRPPAGSRQGFATTTVSVDYNVGDCRRQRRVERARRCPDGISGRRASRAPSASRSISGNITATNTPQVEYREDRVRRGRAHRHLPWTATCRCRASAAIIARERRQGALARRQHGQRRHPACAMRHACESA